MMERRIDAVGLSGEYDIPLASSEGKRLIFRLQIAPSGREDALFIIYKEKAIVYSTGLLSRAMAEYNLL